jgi:hypothetical protein
MGVLPVPLFRVNFSDSGTAQRLPAVRVQCSNGVGTDWEILPSKFLGAAQKYAELEDVAAPAATREKPVMSSTVHAWFLARQKRA